MTEIHGSIPQADLFAREQPAILEGPPKAWETARTIIDFGNALLVATGRLRDDKRIRDAVLLALLRRALVTGEACYELLAHGLLEPAVCQARTLLDIELAIKLIHNDATDRMAHRLAAYHYLTYQRHGQDMLSDRETREEMLAPVGRVPELIQVAKSYARMLETPAFDQIREEVKSSRYWHGLDSPEDAFKAIQKGSDYFMTYDAATWFVHAVNVDHDFVAGDDSQLLKPLVERDPKVIQTLLDHAMLRLLEVIRTFVDERGLPDHPEFQEHSKIVWSDGRSESLDPLHAVMSIALEQFRSSESA